VVGRYPETELYACFNQEVIENLPTVNVRVTLKAYYNLAFLEFEKYVLAKLSPTTDEEDK
jgi:hypothetical protein